MSLNAISGLFSRQSARLGIPSSLSSGIICKFQCGDCNAISYGKSKHLGISAFTEKIVKVDEYVIEDYLFFCNLSSNFVEFSIPASNSSNFTVTLIESFKQ